MKVLHREDGVHLVYEWDRHDELRFLLDYLMKAEVQAPTMKDRDEVVAIEAMIVARLGYIPVFRRLK